MTSQQPAISIVLATDSYETIQPVVQCLLRQTVKARLELIILTPDQESLGLDESDVRGLATIRVLEAGPLHGFARARAVGIRAASAPIIVIGESHSYPDAGWAEALIEAHQHPWAVVVPGFGNANPDGALSWAAFLRDYGCWLAGLPGGEIFMMPTHNSSYKREVLLELGSDLEGALTHGDQLNRQLRARGHRIYFEPTARIEHLNISRPAAWFYERFLCGLMVGGQRARRWPWYKRLFYVAGSPVIPLVVFARSWNGLRRAQRQLGLPIGTIPALVVGAIVSTLGEVAGYARGAGRTAQQHMNEYELHKVRYAPRPQPYASRSVLSQKA
ncbi:MAG TPA: glycosyltransferase [Gemmatimonadales bacterium]|nr:glycosyltransferase [Gemmatimonadales bacterium]